MSTEKQEVFVDKSSPLFEGVATDSAEGSTICWMSHFDYISKPAPGFQVVAHTADCPVAADENPEKNFMQSSSIRKYCIP